MSVKNNNATVAISVLTLRGRREEKKKGEVGQEVREGERRRGRKTEKRRKRPETL